MNTMRPASRIIISLLLLVTLLTATLVVSQVQAGSPENDGRINQLPWVNSWGAIAVYCVNAENKPGDNFTGGAIIFLNSQGQEIFRAPERIINPRRILANRTRTRWLIKRQGLYSLWALPDGYFQITTPPDVEGKISLAIWKDCLGTRILSAAPTITPTPTLDPFVD